MVDRGRNAEPCHVLASPTEPFKSLRVGTFAPNCAEPGLADMDATIDNVRVNP